MQTVSTQELRYRNLKQELEGSLRKWLFPRLGQEPVQNEQGTSCARKHEAVKD